MRIYCISSLRSFTYNKPYVKFSFISAGPNKFYSHKSKNNTQDTVIFRQNLKFQKKCPNNRLSAIFKQFREVKKY